MKIDPTEMSVVEHIQAWMLLISGGLTLISIIAWIMVGIFPVRSFPLASFMLGLTIGWILYRESTIDR